jgi:Restriction endonuclease
MDDNVSAETRMPTGTEYESQIRALDWDGLIGLWDAINRRDQTGWHPGKAFEYLVIRAFELDGAQVRWPYDVELFDSVVEQIDGAIHLPHRSFLVESKDYGKLDVSIEPIAKLRNQLLRRPLGTAGVVFSRTGFTISARLLAQFAVPQAILLWSGWEVEYAVRRKAICEFLAIKYRYCVEHGVPDFDIREEERP